MVVGLFRGEAAAAGKRSPTCCLLLSTCCLLRTACHLHLPPALATLLRATLLLSLTHCCYILMLHTVAALLGAAREAAGVDGDGCLGGRLRTARRGAPQEPVGLRLRGDNQRTSTSVSGAAHAPLGLAACIDVSRSHRPLRHPSPRGAHLSLL